MTQCPFQEVPAVEMRLLRMLMTVQMQKKPLFHFMQVKNYYTTDNEDMFPK